MHGAGVIELREQDGGVGAALHLDDRRDEDEAVARGRALFDLDLDLRPVVEALQDDPLIGPSVRATPGRRVPGVVDPNELAIRAVLGQQVSVAGAATLAGRIAADCGEPLAQPVGAVTHLFPTAEQVAALMTTTQLSLAHPKEIIDEYLTRSFHSIFLRPISPYGFAVRTRQKTGYDMDAFLEFYKTGLDHILQINRNGYHLVFWNQRALQNFRGEKPAKFGGNNDETFDNFDAKQWKDTVQQLD